MAKELETLFDSKARPKILNLFFQNPEEVFSSKDVAKKCQITPTLAKKELEKLQKIRLLLRQKQKKFVLYNLNPKFPFLRELREMITSASPVSFEETKKVFKNIPRLKLMFVSGEFLKESRSPVDILLVGNNIPQSKISKAVQKVESEAGKDLRWASMNLKEFNYRSNINDRFLSDILTHKHKIILNKIKWSAT